ncbi:MAG: prohibitin family protein [Saprospiraceae bacterium]|nr:prohibitin family protein [Saprospiraceae bacterium]
MTKSKISRWTSLLLLIIFFTSCATIREGEVGVKRTLGKYADKTYTEGLRFYNPFLTSIIKISTQTENLEVGLSIPSKEGLNIVSEVSILYRVVAKEAPSILRNIGQNYEQNIILPVFRSSVADVTSRFYAKDMHTGERTTIEKAIRDQMMVYLDGKGLVIDAVLLKSIRLPASLARAIEQKLEAEQDAQRMEFVLQQAEREAEQKRIEAKGIRDAQKIIAEGLSPAILQFKSIEAFMELSKSPNAKIIVSDGDLPMIMEEGVAIPAAPGKKSGISRVRGGDN